MLLTTLVNCPVDRTVTIEMTLDQGTVTGTGRANGKCQGQLVECPMQVSVRQGAPFSLEPADATITATVREGHRILDVQEWERTVEIGLAP